MAKIKDVAERAGVSLMTVSRVLNNNGYVSEEKRRRVLESARELNYQPNLIARSLVLNRTSTIGILVCHLENPVYAQYVAGISETLRGYGMDIILYSAETRNTWLNGIRTLLSKQVDGLILASVQFDMADENPIPWEEARPTGIALMKENKKPFVTIGNNEIIEGGTNGICPDYYTGMKIAAEYLVKMGHRKIAYFHFYENWKERSDAFQDVMNQAGIFIPQEWDFDCDLDSIVSAHRSAADWLDRIKDLPSAVCCDNDAFAAGLMQALHERGIRVPEDLSVIGNDGNVYSLCTSPRLTTVSIQPMEVGHVAAERMMELLRNPEKTEKETLIPPKFQEGGTVRRIPMEAVDCGR